MNRHQKKYATLIAMAVVLVVACHFALPPNEPSRPPGAILNAMNAVHDGHWTNNSEPARNVLLQHIKPGTDIAQAIGALSAEGFACDDPAEVSTTANCQFLTMKGWTGYQRWIIDLQFDE